MPIYEFMCDKCGKFDELCKVGEVEKECPTCKTTCTKVPISQVAPAVWNTDSATVSQGKQNLCKGDK